MRLLLAFPVVVLLVGFITLSLVSISLPLALGMATRLGANNLKGGDYYGVPSKKAVVSWKEAVVPLSLSSSRLDSSAPDRIPVLMKCDNPYMGRSGVHGCGQCTPCRINRSRVSMHRIILEEAQYKESAFVTLTYEDKHTPRTAVGYGELIDGDTPTPLPTLSIRDYQLFLKRLRKSLAPIRIRYYSCGEYGDQTFRPHYHLILFGFPPCVRVTGTKKDHYKNNLSCCPSCDLVRDCWGKGLIHIGPSGGDDVARYVSGYVVKKFSKDHVDLKGRIPEFGKWSQGLGVSAMDEVASELLALDPAKAFPEGDVPSTLRHGKKLLPLGRYLRGQLRKRVGWDEKAPEVVRQAKEAEMRSMREDFLNRSADRSPGEKGPSLKQEVVDDNQGARANLEAREKLYRQRRKL